MTARAQNADFRRLTSSPGNSSIWRAQETAENRGFPQKTEDFEIAENRKKLQIGFRHLRCVTLSSVLFELRELLREYPETLPFRSENGLFAPRALFLKLGWFPGLRFQDPKVACHASPRSRKHPKTKAFLLFFFGEGQKGTPGRGRDRKCHDRASRSRPLVLPLGPLTSLTISPLFCTSEDVDGRGGGGGL